MSHNPYANPTLQVNVTDPVAEEGLAPALWNPNAAAGWSLIFSPVFGAYLHMKNWQALGEPELAATAKTWSIASLVGFLCYVLILAFFPDSALIEGIGNFGGFILLIAWYAGHARAQAAYVRERFGKTYPRKGWSKPIGLGVLGIFGLFLVVAIMAFIVAFVSGV